MPYDAFGIWTDIPNITAVPGDTIQSEDWNNYRADIALNALNFPRPIVAGGTGANSAGAALDSLGAAALDRDQAYTKGQRSTPNAVVFASVIELTLANRNDFYLASVTGNFTLANPPDIATHIGWKGDFCGQQDATGARTISFGTYFFPIGTAIAPQLPSAPNAKWRIDMHVVTATRIDYSLRQVGG